MLAHIHPQDVVEIARQAGSQILKLYRTAARSITKKPDDSPLTAADLASHQLILQALKELTPTLPILSEESDEIAFRERRHWSTFWLVDPLDGTQEFIHRTGEFSINIALIEDHQPVLGVVAIPVADEYFFAKRGLGAFKQRQTKLPISIHTVPCASPLRIAVSRRHGQASDQLLDQLGPHVCLPVGSALKFCWVAEGKIDLYPRFGRTAEWDTASGQCILEEAGGLVINTETGAPLRYNTTDAYFNPGFLAAGDPHYAWYEELRRIQKNT